VSEDEREWVRVGIAFKCHPRVHSTDPESWSWMDILNCLLAGLISDLQTIGGTVADAHAEGRREAVDGVLDIIRPHYRCEAPKVCGKDSWRCGNCQVLDVVRAEGS
jgi:hypothetical protein